MLKRLMLKYWPLVLLFILIMAVIGMSRYAEHRKAEHQENTQASSPEATVSPLSADKSSQKANEPKYPPSWVDTFAWPEGVTAWALFLTLFVIAWQSVETHAAAEAGMKAVEATHKQTELTFQMERAKLSLTTQGIDIEEIEGYAYL